MTADRAYHHGDLRASLLAHSLQVVESHGYEAVSLRALAEALGVSRGAPYRHFPERDYLLAELAAVGFQRLDSFAADIALQSSDPVGRLVNAARQFLQFVDEHPQLFRLMYESGLLQRANSFPHLAQAQREVYEKIFALYSAAAVTLPDLDEKGIRARVIAFWSTIFGYAKLRQATLLQPYMTGDLSAPSIVTLVIQTAIGLDIASGLAAA